jgi:hypothetical protein
MNHAQESDPKSADGSPKILSAVEPSTKSLYREEKKPKTAVNARMLPPNTPPIYKYVLLFERLLDGKFTSI